MVLSTTINQSMQDCTFPTALKLGVVTPVHKSGDKQQITNYRPICILPTISKIYEKIIAEQLINHLNSFALLNPLQFGFRSGYSTETACCFLIEEIKSKLDRGGVVGAVFLDLRKAFDIVSHNILINKLSSYKLSEQTIIWLKSYLGGRQQCVRLNNILSPLKEYTVGVPQGSILGPLLFSIYINDLPSACTADVIMYADDTVLFVHAKNEAEVSKQLTIQMQNVAVWLSQNNLTLNTDKTVAMYFTNRIKHQNYPTIYINGRKIENVDEFTYLGVTLDPTLTFKNHVKKW